ncbi:glycosyltransferase family 4 protein [Demequina sp. SYSU T00068]|uniref:glycosyltransferase family 4 protein n=1 Tax=Demequina lignilytica TaxID=3051663 RepID=UPI0026281DD4|nr:glycosyltransferase family 4 protein [Demequina sp. SYSU T00068]MDN4490650.1 glycosyltransferase family 4 protein [Demequina sp. SYSU T00068]
MARPVVLVQHPHGAEISGVSTYVANIDRALSSCEGAEVRVVSSKTDSLRTRLEAMTGVDYVHLNSNDLPLAIAARLARKRVSIKYHWPFWLSTRDTFAPVGWRRRLAVELVYIWHEYLMARGPIAGARAYARLTMRLVTFAIVPTRLACSDFTARAVEAGSAVVGVPNPFDLDASASQTDEARTSSALEFRFVFVGRVVRDKGVDLLLRASAVLAREGRDFSVSVIGDGDAFADVRALATELGLDGHVDFVGRRTPAEILETLESALALVYPARWEDPAPYPPLEAAARGVVTIAADVGGLPETAGPDAYYFAREDVQALAAAMRTCLNDPGEAVRRGRAARERAQSRYGLEPAAAALLAAIR